MISKTLAKRFWAKVKKAEGDGCWEWTAAKNHKTGRGYIRVHTRERERPWEAPRAAWLLETGQDPGELSVCHTCDNPNCVRFSHLYLATNAQNLTDAAAHGLMRSGDDHPATKLTDAQVREVRARLSTGVRVGRLAREYGVSHSLISMIRSGVTRRKVA